jgi:hypothetical protein
MADIKRPAAKEDAASLSFDDDDKDEAENEKPYAAKH